MRIAELHIYQQDLPVAGRPYTMAGTALSAMDSTLVKLVTDTGHVGWGETCPLGPTYAPAHASGARAALQQMAPGLIGTHVTPRSVHAAMDGLLSGHAYAKAALDIATHDALARCLDIPVATLLGGALRDRLPAYTAIGIEDPDEAARIAADRIAQGYTRLQLKLGGRPPEADIATLRKVDEIASPAGIRLVGDANRGWTVAHAITVSQACRDIPLTLEQPCASLAEHRQLRPQLCHPLYLDESVTDLDTLATILGDGLADGFGLKLTRAGGLAPMAATRDLLAARHLPHTCDDSWGGDIVAAACLHLAATVHPRQLDGVWIAAPYIAAHLDPENGPAPRNGQLTLPPSPGLGVAPDETALGTPCASFEAP